MMQMKWSPKALTLAEIPKQIREHQRYQGKDFWVSEARRSEDMLYIRLIFEDKAEDTWHYDAEDDQWRLTGLDTAAS